jgi:hypothetical protein
MKELSCLVIISILALSGLASEEVMTNCPYELYGTRTTGPTGTSDLLAIDPTDGSYVTVASISGGAHNISNISFHTNGKIYAIGEDENNTNSLYIINCKTGLAFLVGATGLPTIPGQAITDTSFQGDVLWAYLNRPGNVSDRIGTIDMETGIFTLLGDTGINDIGNGLSFDLDDTTLYHAGKLNLSSIDQTTGSATTIVALSFSAPANANPRLNGLDPRPSNGIMYAAINDKAGSTSPAENYVGTIDLTTGVVSFLSATPINIPSLEGLAFNPKHKGELPIK